MTTLPVLPSEVKAPRPRARWRARKKWTPSSKRIEIIEKLNSDDDRTPFSQALESQAD